jgi:hypothetical protein
MGLRPNVHGRFTLQKMGFVKAARMSDNWLVRITPELFSAFLLCPTKCWLKSVGEHGTGNAYAEWVQAQNESYRVAGIDRLRLARPPRELMHAPPTEVRVDIAPRTEGPAMQPPPKGPTYSDFVRRDYQSPAALTFVERFEKNRDKLFTFLKYDGVPWNNNNADHAMKAFAWLRDVIEGMSNEKGLKEYLVLLSICQTCQYQGLDFLDFLRSGETDIEVFAASQQRRRKSARYPKQERVSKRVTQDNCCRPGFTG